MKIKVSLSRRHAFLIMFSFVILVSSFAVYAYKSGQSPSILGHSAEEIEITLANGTVVSLQQAISGSMIKVAVAGGVCMNGITGLWDAQQQTFGGASCSSYIGTFPDANYYTPQNTARVVCPANAPNKIVVSAMNNNGKGGEGAVCF